MDAQLLSLREMARTLRVPPSWLKREALARRVPALRAGSRLLFNAEAVNKALLEIASEANGGEEKP